ncbi:S41 family peptidase [Peptostreptococcus equinus]|uniref:S41 family peptidase n=1 Tax=Peptostreptococcus equinus TaxID=3003601 RepID=A0ABY7JNY8_9FIRM|nr:S41 family peptidase [Peptostreptococcus sp. CBA3647]WAW15084.1 S41 family peptidase [Peptostreptococcus sp. CBA3647]
MIKNKKSFIKMLITIVATALVTTFVLTSVGFVGIIPHNQYKRYKKLISLNKEIDKKFYKKPDEAKLEEGMIKGMFQGTEDVYSSYYTKDEMKQLLEMSSGKYVGIGIMVSPDKESGAIKIENVFDGGTAKEAGVKKGDYIIKVNDKAYTYQEMDIAVKNIKGDEGTSVVITFVRDGKPYVKELKRKEITIKSVESKMMDNKIGYIKIKGFEEDTEKDFRSSIDRLEKDNMKALVIDLRDNGGGLLNIVEGIADMILGKSVIVYTQDREGNKDYSRSTDKEKISVPIVVLTNENSASASEILTGAILDNDAGISIGRRTYGKGLVQSVIQLSDKSGYKLTTAQYFTPDGHYINKKGIKPTIEVKEDGKQLPKAIEYLQKKIK